MPQVKISVIKKTTEDELFKKYAHENENPVCQAFDVGDQFIVSPQNFEVPKGFCPSAWHSISEHVSTLIHGGNFSEWDWMKDDKTAISCCNDGVRPVFFKIATVKDSK